MTVKDLIEFLQRQPQDILVTYQQHSEQVLLEKELISLYQACIPRADGWVQDKRSDMPTQTYLGFPGN